METKSVPVWRQIFSKNMLIAFLMGMSSGLPLLLTLSTMQAWMKNEGVDLTKIGLMTLTGIPYTIKFLWAPLFDKVSLPFLGRRRGWLLVIQTFLAFSIILLGRSHPANNLTIFFLLTLLVTFFSASQDIVIDAYRREALKDSELGLGTSLYVNGYRIAMIIAGAGALMLSDHLPWRTVYLIMGGFVGVGLLTTLFAKEPEVEAPLPKDFRTAVIGPFVDYFKRDGSLWILAFILFYKIGDQMATTMTMPFYLDLGFSKTEVAAVVKIFGVWATITGGLLGGIWMLKLKIHRALWIFGLLQMVTILGFVLLGIVGKSIPVLALVIAGENLAGGMGTSAYAAYMAGLTNKQYTATQYALLSALMGIPRVFASAPTGYIAENFGYQFFFLFCTLMAIPGLIILKFKILPKGE